jgi:hypothetical protein
MGIQAFMRGTVEKMVCTCICFWLHAALGGVLFPICFWLHAALGGFLFSN